VLTEAYGLDEAPQAYERVEQGKSRFRAVLVMN
jgi:D-arabinose 1-dehydrogenase-like Zn-dependent alcohol dehydrogenase